jgi:predicted Zn finger-like uncharacterized protein
MIVTCASCLTKFNLEDSRIPEKGAKVRCSRCHHVFYVVPPPETKEEIIEDFESFAKYHEDLIGPGARGEETPSSPIEEEEEKKERAPQEEEEKSFLFSGKVDEKKEEEIFPRFSSEEKEEAEAPKHKKRKAASKERRGPSLFFALIIIVIFLVFGLFYFWTEVGTSGKISSYISYPVDKVTALWNEIWGTEKKGLTFGGLNGYEEKIGDVSFFVIEGKVSNQSRSVKKYVKVRVGLFDQNRTKIAEKETLCGRVIPRGDLANLPSTFFNEGMNVQPQTEEEKVLVPGKSIPFMVILKDVPRQAKDINFKVEIVEAPNL